MNTDRPIRLIGKDADRFLEQVRYGRSKRAARESLARGIILVDELSEKGSVKVTVRHEIRAI